MTTPKAPQGAEMQRAQPLSRKTQHEVELLTIDARAVRSNGVTQPPQFRSGRDAINAHREEMNGTVLEPRASSPESCESLKAAESASGWVN